MSTASADWLEANQRYLSAALGVVRARLEWHAAGTEGKPKAEEECRSAQEALRELGRTMPVPPALETLRAAFRL